MFREDCFLLGTLTKVHGIQGELNLVFKNESSYEYEHLESVFIEIDGKLAPFFIDTFRPKDKENCLISFDDIVNEEEAQELKDCDLFAELIDKPESYKESEFELSHLIGYELFDKKTSLGRIIDIEPYTNNEQFVIKHENQDILIPANQELIKEILHDSNRLIMDLPEGLLEVN